MTAALLLFQQNQNPGISYHDQYVLQPGTTAAALNPPANTLAGDLDIIWVVNKNSSITPTDPAGWTLMGQASVGTGADGAGTGQLKFSVWWRVLTAASTSTTVTVTGANMTQAGGIVYRKENSREWAPSVSFGSDTSSDTPFSATVASNLGAKVGDWIVSVSVFTANTTLSARGMTTPGLTSLVAGINSGGTANGNDCFMWTDHCGPATAGTLTAPSISTGTANAATTGGCANILITTTNYFLGAIPI